MTEPEQVLFELDENGVAVLTLNRPEKYNAFTLEMIKQWHRYLVQAGANPEVKTIVLTGAGRAFCAGGDANAMKKRAGNDALERKNFLWHHVHSIAREMQQLDKPVIAAINGVARGAGMDMALMCDIRIMAESATLAESYINMGLIAGDGGTWYLPRIVGLDRALELLWTGRVVDATEAEQIGLVTEVVPEGAALTAARELATRIAAQPMEAIRFCKRSLYQGMDMQLATHLDMLSSHLSVLRDTEDHRAKVSAFLNRRKKK